MKLFGSTTSPFVRRVRVVAHEIGQPFDLVDSATDEGQAALRRVSPVWKVPVAEVDGRILLDSRTIIEWLTMTRGWGGLAAPRDGFLQRNQLSAIDAALDSAVQIFYLQRDGLDPSKIATTVKNRERIASILAWVEAEIAARRFGLELGLAELSLLCTLDWMEFREVHPVASHPLLAPLRQTYRDRPSLVATRPHA
jgi:glutathione S-transferase